MDIPPIVMLGFQIICSLLIALALWNLGQVSNKLEENTKSTNTIATNSARTDTKVDLLTARVETIAERTHTMSQDVTELKTLEKVRSRNGNGQSKRSGHG